MVIERDDSKPSIEHTVYQKRQRSKLHFFCCFKKFQDKVNLSGIQLALLFLFSYEFWLLCKIGYDFYNFFRKELYPFGSFFIQTYFPNRDYITMCRNYLDDRNNTSSLGEIKAKIDNAT
jgi:hypothetical protein